MANSKHLALASAPFRASFLSIPPSPQSPLSPLECQTRIPPRRPSAHRRPSLPIPSLNFGSDDHACLAFRTTFPPTPALSWVWQCHICHRTYPLGVTRRCLDDGHHFCAGEPRATNVRGQPRQRSSLRHGQSKACASEFDYTGWRAWGEWRRDELVARRHDRAAIDKIHAPLGKNCFVECDYPSECRWAAKQTGTVKPDTLVATVFARDVDMVDVPSDAEHADHDLLSATSFEEILGLSISSAQQEDIKMNDAANDVDAQRLWNALLVDTRATRKGRHRRRSSPLADSGATNSGLCIIEE